MAHIYQLNCRKTEAATIMTVGRNPDSIYLLQEIYYDKRGKPGVRTKSHFYGKSKSRAGIYLSSLTSCTFVPLHQFIDTDIAAGTVEGGSVTKSTVVASVYFHDNPLGKEQPTVLPKFRELVEFCEEKGLPLISGIDCNAHSALWGSPDTNKRGEDLEEFIFQNGLYVQNVGSTPTWVSRGLSSIINITATSGVRNRISNWHVTPEHTFSDHKLLSFTLDEPQGGKILTRNYARANWSTFASIIEADLEEPPSLWSTDIIESASLMLTQLIQRAFNAACPEHLAKKRDKIFWWNLECQNAKTHYIQL